MLSNPPLVLLSFLPAPQQAILSVDIEASLVALYGEDGAKQVLQKEGGEEEESTSATISEDGEEEESDADETEEDEDEYDSEEEEEDDESDEE